MVGGRHLVQLGRWRTSHPAVPGFNSWFWVLTLVSCHCRPWKAAVMAQAIRSYVHGNIKSSNIHGKPRLYSQLLALSPLQFPWGRLLGVLPWPAFCLSIIIIIKRRRHSKQSDDRHQIQCRQSPNRESILLPQHSEATVNWLLRPGPPS